MSSYKFVSMVSEGSDELMTLVKIPGFWEKLFGKKEKEIQLIGGSTCWSYYPSFNSVGTLMNCMLLEFWKKEVYFRKKRERDK